MDGHVGNALKKKRPYLEEDFEREKIGDYERRAIYGLFIRKDGPGGQQRDGNIIFIEAMNGTEKSLIYQDTRSIAKLENCDWDFLPFRL